MSILFDLDNTVYDLLGSLEDRFDYKRSYQKTYSFSGIKGINTKDVYSLFKQPDFFYGLKPFKHVLETIEWLNSEGHSVMFYSNCDNEGVAESKLERLNKDLTFNPLFHWYTDGNMPSLSYDILVDDYKEKVEGLLGTNPELKVVMQEHEYNKGLKGKNVRYLNPLSKHYLREFSQALGYFRHI